MPRFIDPRRQSLPIDKWPAQDRMLWQTATVIRPRSFRRQCYVETLSPVSLEKTQDGYGRWLGFLTWRGNLDITVDPAMRVTSEALEEYFELLRMLGNADNTIVGRFEELHRALKIMMPGRDFKWILRPGGIPIRGLLPMRTRSITVYHPLKLCSWGLTLMKNALALNTQWLRSITYRDGLIICILASRAPRLRSLTGIQIGKNLTKQGQNYHLAFEPDDIKNKRALDFDLPVNLTEYIDHYLAVERPALLGTQVHDYLWVHNSGTPLTLSQIGDMIQRRSMKMFGKRFGPHRFRHCIGTAAPMEDPQHPGVAAAILGITARMLEASYNVAGQVEASHSYTEVIRQARTNSRRRKNDAPRLLNGIASKAGQAKMVVGL